VTTLAPRPLDITRLLAAQRARVAAGPNPLQPAYRRTDWVQVVRAGLGVHRAVFGRYLHDTRRIVG